MTGIGGTRTNRWGTVALGVVLATVVAAGGRSAAAEPDTAGGVVVPTIAWTPCVPGEALQCASVRVPLDHDRPTGPQITLAVARLPALDPAHRLGSVFVNPGGPGGSGVDMVAGVALSLSVALRGRFDIVGFDPRGIARSTPLVCFTDDAELDLALAPWPYPLGAAQERRQERYDRQLAESCSTHASSIIDHMSTADVARDLDLLRAGVGDSSLTYLGYSYGTQIGTTYANLFPHRVRAMVLDGVLDPIAWTTGTPANRAPFSYRLHSDLGARASLQQFFARCDRAAGDADATTTCPFGPHAGPRFAAIDLTLRLRPPDLGGGFSFTEPELIAITLGSLYSPFAWPALAELLASLEHPEQPARITSARHAVATALGVAAAPPFPQTAEGFPGVACADSDNPSLYLAWPWTAAAAEAADGYFGRIWTWASSACQPWPGSRADRYAGPWNARTQNPVLVVGNRYDPATRHQGAVVVSRLLPNSRLVTYAGWGHTAFMNAGSRCVDTMVVDYLLTRRVPGVGTVCGIEFDPFATGAPGVRARGATAPVRSPVGLPPAVVRALRD
jgi:pimeloyl-ACP methyl ester carboxylesterase